VKKALVAGGLGVIGRNLVEHLNGLDDWEVVGLSRRLPDFSSRAQFISVDLLDPANCERKLANLADITHVFFAAYQDRPTPAEQVGPNLAMLRNLVDALKGSATSIERIVLFQGAKAYGVHLGPFKTPARESDLRHIPPNFYYDQEDFLRMRSQTTPWTVLRPDVVCGFAIGNPMNLAMVMAVYAVISRELGLPLRFPGKPGAYGALAQVTDAGLLARATTWAATEPRCANEIFNVTNGDFFRWEHLWPAVAKAFEMPVAQPQRLALADYMTDKAPLWESITQRYGLRPVPYASVAAWPFGDFIFGCDYDVMSDTTKIRQVGFHEAIDSEAMFLSLFDRLRHERIIP